MSLVKYVTAQKMHKLKLHRNYIPPHKKLQGVELFALY